MDFFLCYEVEYCTVPVLIYRYTSSPLKFDGLKRDTSKCKNMYYTKIYNDIDHACICNLFGTHWWTSLHVTAINGQKISPFGIPGSSNRWAGIKSVQVAFNPIDRMERWIISTFDGWAFTKINRRSFGQVCTIDRCFCFFPIGVPWCSHSWIKVRSSSNDFSSVYRLTNRISISCRARVVVMFTFDCSTIFTGLPNGMVSQVVVKAIFQLISQVWAIVSLGYGRRWSPIKRYTWSEFASFRHLIEVPSLKDIVSWDFFCATK